MQALSTATATPRHATLVADTPLSHLASSKRQRPVNPYRFEFFIHLALSVESLRLRCRRYTNPLHRLTHFALDYSHQHVTGFPHHVAVRNKHLPPAPQRGNHAVARPGHLTDALARARSTRLNRHLFYAHATESAQSNLMRAVSDRRAANG